MDALKVVNYVISVIFILCYSYQFLYILVPVFKKARPHRRGREHRYAVLISARNERAVIGNLLDSISRQSYDGSLVTTFVVADNCTDDTASIAREHGAVVFERFDTSRIGKGYALAFLMERIDELYPQHPFEGYFVFDADNVLEESYIEEMDRTFSDGYEVVTSYRNSKNYGDNWISAGYALWFLRESQFLNRCRMRLGTSAAVSGTGFLFSRRAIDECGGWHFFLLTEDIEFTIECVTRGWKIGYCEKAVLYDEQPTRFIQSWHQRLRWSRGYIQVFGKYGGKLIRGVFRGSFACYDMSMAIMPAAILSFAGLGANLAAIVLSIASGHGLDTVLTSLGSLLVNSCLTVLVIGTVTTVTEWRHIYAPAWKKVLYNFTFPLFMLTYIPISFAALFTRRVGWKHIEHTRSATVADIRAAQKAKIA